MVLTQVFHWLATIIFGFMFIWWGKKDLLNLIIKTIFFIAFVLGVVVLLIDYAPVLGLNIGR